MIQVPDQFYFPNQCSQNQQNQSLNWDFPQPVSHFYYGNSKKYFLEETFKISMHPWSFQVQTICQMDCIDRKNDEIKLPCRNIQFQKSFQTGIASKCPADRQQKVQIKIGESKNIPKNFGKQIIKFIKQNQKLVTKTLQQINSNVSYTQLSRQLTNLRKSMRKIGDLQRLWSKQFAMGFQVRVISNLFLRRSCCQWIYNSRIENSICHLKYRKVLLNHISKPDQFVCLKSDY